MCGITGLIARSGGGEAALSRVERMSAALVHRGPDSQGVYRDGGVTLGVRRLRIIDIAGGDQPLYNEDYSLALTVNGEIYNFMELREELERKGHVFRTRSDCETILHLYEESGADCLHKMRGMFAFALHDKRKGEVFIARDRLGEKPLYYCFSGGEFIFSSEIKSLLSDLRPRGLELEPDAVNMYLHYQYVPEPLTPVKGVKKLSAAHFIRLKTADLSFAVRKYWDIDNVVPVTGDPAELIRESFNELGKYILRADVPVGISLSGGLDSSAIACVARRHSSGGLTAFSVGYPGRPGCDERALAENLAGRLGMAFHSAELRTDALVESFPGLVRAMDDPIADVAAFGYYSVSRLAREHGVPVLLFGFGADELFWGYRWARESIGWNLLKKDVREGKPFSGLPLKDRVRIISNVSRRRMLLHPLTSAAELGREMAVFKSKFTENPDQFILWGENQDFRAAFGLKQSLYSAEFARAVNDDLLYALFSTRDWASVPLKTCRFLLDPWNVSNALPQGDRLGMSFSVENRLPFMDHKFIELVLGLRKTFPEDYKLGSKAWFKKAMRGIVPGDVISRRKTGFIPPRGEWLKAVVGHYGGRCLGGRLEAAGIMRGPALENFFKTPFTGHPGKLFFAYKLVLLELWLEMFMEGKSCGGNE